MIEMNKIDIVENIAVVTTVAASCMISFFAKDANFALVFSLFLISAAALVITTSIKKQWAIMRLQAFFVAINTFALLKEVL